MKSAFFLVLSIIFCRQISFVKPLQGQNVRNARSNEFPFVVSFYRINKGRANQPKDTHVCTGTLITRKDVATAAHCVNDEMKISIRIMSGSVDYRRGQRYYIFWWLTYDVWAERKGIEPELEYNDIVNIRLTTAVSSSIIPIEIPNLPNERINRLQVTAVGWSTSNGTYINPILKVADLQVITVQRSLEIVGDARQDFIRIIEKQSLFTYMVPFILLNFGDSGGPLLYRNQLVGIHVGVYPNNEETNDNQLINVHSSIHYYRSFFMEVIQLGI